MNEYPEPAEPGTGSPKPPGNLTVLLLDDHSVMLESVRAIVETDDTLTVVATANRVADTLLKLPKGYARDAALVKICEEAEQEATQ